jgi:pentatricopeptide repeat protein
VWYETRDEQEVKREKEGDVRRAVRLYEEMAEAFDCLAPDSHSPGSPRKKSSQFR